jgi:O-antigen ligase
MSHNSQVRALSYRSFLRYVIFAFLLFIPFQRIIFSYLKLPQVFNWSDEIFITVIVLSGVFYMRELNKLAFQFLIFLAIFVLICSISGLMNGNPIVVTLLGIFDYVKNFLVIPFIGIFISKKKHLLTLHRLLYTLALFFCVVAIIQFFGHLAGVPLHLLGEVYSLRRLGFWRVSSLLGHPNIFGFYTLIFFIIDINLHRRLRWQNVLFSIGIFLCTSRLVWAAYGMTLGLFLFPSSGRWKKLKPAFSVGLIVFVIVMYILMTSTGLAHEYRVYTFFKGLDILKEHPVLGVGPGMYGGVISLMFNSPLYETYPFSPYWRNQLQAYRSLDQFWIQSLVELGIVGTCAFLFILFLLHYLAGNASRKARNDSFTSRFNGGLAYMPLVVGIYLLGSGLNHAAFLLTYTTLFGMALHIADPSSFFKNGKSRE